MRKHEDVEAYQTVGSCTSAWICPTFPLLCSRAGCRGNVNTGPSSVQCTLDVSRSDSEGCIDSPFGTIIVDETEINVLLLCLFERLYSPIGSSTLLVLARSFASGNSVGFDMYTV